MNAIRFLSILILFTILLSSCGRKVSQIDYDRQVYEYDQLKLRYDLLQQEIDGGTTSTDQIPQSAVSTKNEDYNKEYEALQQKYEQLLKEYNSLQVAHEDLKLKKEEATPIAPGGVSRATYNELKEEKTDLEKRYVILENRYNALKEFSEASNASSITSAEILEPIAMDADLNVKKGKPEMKQNPVDVHTEIIQSASFDGLFFDFDTYERTEAYLVVEIAVKNNSKSSLKTFWNADKIQLIDKFGRSYTANYFRVGVDYAKSNNTLTKKIKDENTVFARFAFEDLPSDIKHIQSLKFMILVDGEERPIEFTSIDISQIEE